MTTKIDWKTRALAAEASRDALQTEVAELRERLEGRTVGRPVKKAKTEDSRLVLEVCERLGLNKTELAVKLGVTVTIVSRTNKIPLAEHHRERLREMLREMLTKAPAR